MRANITEKTSFAAANGNLLKIEAFLKLIVTCLMRKCLKHAIEQN